MSTDVDGDEPGQRMVTPDPYPAGVYSAPSYPPVTAAADTPVTPPPAPADAPAAPRPPQRRGADGDLLGRVGDIEVTAGALRTPSGRIPLSAASVEVAEERVVRTPTWAVFCAIVGSFVAPVISLLFLLVKESSPTGPVRVRVTGAGVRHETVVTDPAEVELALRLGSPAAAR